MFVVFRQSSSRGRAPLIMRVIRPLLTISNQGGSGVHVGAIAITERERGTDEAPDGRVMQGDTSGRGRAGRRRRRDRTSAGVLDWAAGVESAGLPGRDKRAAGLAPACAPAG